MGATQSEIEEADFELGLQQLSCDMIRLCYLHRPVTFDWCYGDFLYTNIRFVALVAGKIEIWSLSMGPVI
jgi:hypothetical protein